MPGFQFELSQLVNVPGKDGLQGRVSSRMEDVNNPSLYQVSWLQEDCKSLGFEIFAEADLMLAQLPPEPDWLPEVSFKAAANDDAPVRKSARQQRRVTFKRKSRR